MISTRTPSPSPGRHQERPDLEPAAFYDRLAPFYQLIYPDWEQAVERHGGVLDEVIRERWGDGAKEILDAACGIGTQTFGLAETGHHLTGSDISERALERASDEAAARKLDITFVAADMRRLQERFAPRAFDVVVACDNALPHLLSDDELLAAFRSFYESLRPGGGFVVSVRDYAAMALGGTQVEPYGVHTVGGQRHLIFQVWDFPVENVYTLSLYFVTDRGDDRCEARVARTRYYTVSIERLIELARAAGFVDVERLDGRFFQPLLVGTRPAR